MINADIPRADEAVEQLVTTHMPLVAHIVRETLGRVPAHVNRDDLTSAGLLALVQAAQVCLHPGARRDPG